MRERNRQLEVQSFRWGWLLMRCTTTRSKHFRFRQYVEYSGEMFTSAQFTQRAVLKFAHYTEATLIAGQFTNQFHPAFREPQLLIETGPLTDQASYAAQVRQLCHPVQHQVVALGRSDVVAVGP
ncbi:hypothetical protein quinque_010933 [Culex quinquefasciatus]